MTDEERISLRELASFDCKSAPTMDNITHMKRLMEEGNEEDFKFVRKLLLNRFSYMEGKSERDGKHYGGEKVHVEDGFLYRMAYDYEDKFGSSVTAHAVGACWCTMTNFIKINGFNSLKMSKEDVEDAECELGEIITKKLKDFDPERTKVTAYFHNDMTHILLQTKGSTEKKYHNDLMGRVEKALNAFAAEGRSNPTVQMIVEKINKQGYARDVQPKQILNCLKRRHEMVSISDLSKELPDDMMTPEEQLIKEETNRENRGLLESLPDTEIKTIVMGYIDRDPERIVVNDIYKYAQEVHGYTGSKNTFEHDYRSFKRYLLRYSGINPNKRSDLNRAVYSDISITPLRTRLEEGSRPELDDEEITLNFSTFMDEPADDSNMTTFGGSEDRKSVPDHRAG